MKKWLLVILASVLALSLLSACSSPDAPADGASATVTLDGETITLSDASAGKVEGKTLTITKGGTYTVSGTLTDGRIVVEVSKEINVTLVLSGASLSCSDSAPIFVRSAKNCYIELADGTSNTVSDGAEYVYENALETEPSAAIFAKCDLIIRGSGALTVNGNYNNGIASKDDLEVKSGNLTITAKNNGLKGKDSVVIKQGEIKVDSVGDAIKADQDNDPAKGYVMIEGGNLTLKAGDEGLQAKTSVTVNGGSITIEAESNGIKADIDVKLNAGNVTVTCGSDGVDCPSISGSLTVNGEKVSY